MFTPENVSAVTTPALSVVLIVFGLDNQGRVDGPTTGTTGMWLCIQQLGMPDGKEKLMA